MPNPIIYMRGFPAQPSGFRLDDEAMVRDLKLVAGLPDEQVEALRQRLTKSEGFLDPKTLRATVAEVIEEEDAADAVRTVLHFLTPSDVKDLLESWEKTRGEKDFPFESDTFERLKRALLELITPYSALIRFGKAERLATVTGNELESVELICDFRPIFNDSREMIEGMMPYTRMRVVTRSADGLPRSFDAELTHKDVSDLADKAKKAVEKLKVMTEAVQTWVPNGLPDLPLTRISSEDPKDA